MGHTPIRTCVVCRRRRPKRELVRIVASPQGVALDERAQLPGRGAYVCPDPACVQGAARRGAQSVRRALRRGDEQEVTAALARISPRGAVSKEQEA